MRKSPISEAVLESHSHKLQIIITRDVIHFSHSALRLIDDDRMLFWDPAGSYGLTDHYAEFYTDYPLPNGFKKQNDLIVAGIPTLGRYWAFSRYTGDIGMEVLEWDLNGVTAGRYYVILLQGCRNDTRSHDFRTKRHFLLCSSNLTRFLVRFTQDSIGLQETCFFPDNLAHALYELNPDRVIFFDGEGVRIFTKNKI